MKITLTKIHFSGFGLYINNGEYYDLTDSIEHQLFLHLFTLVYDNPTPFGDIQMSTIYRKLQAIKVDLPDMAKQLREKGWCVYYWRDKEASKLDKYNSQINIGVQEGLIFGQYCGNLMSWLLAHT